MLLPAAAAFENQAAAPAWDSVLPLRRLPLGVV
jgi:hypothetical protein